VVSEVIRLFCGIGHITCFIYGTYCDGISAGAQHNCCVNILKQQFERFPVQHDEADVVENKQLHAFEGSHKARERVLLRVLLQQVCEAGSGVKAYLSAVLAVFQRDCRCKMDFALITIF